MSLLPAEEVSYLEIIAEFFVARRGVGLLLSPLDVELVRRYEGAGVPFEVVCRGVEKAFERRRQNGKPPHRSLRSCRRSIDAEVRRHQQGNARGPNSPVPALELDRLLGLARQSKAADVRAAYRAAYRAACLGQEPATAGAFGFLQGLPRTAQRDLCERVRRSVGPRLAAVDAAQYRERLRTALIRAALDRGHLELMSSLSLPGRP